MGWYLWLSLKYSQPLSFEILLLPHFYLISLWFSNYTYVRVVGSFPHVFCTHLFFAFSFLSASVWMFFHGLFKKLNSLILFFFFFFFLLCTEFLLLLIKNYSHYLILLFSLGRKSWVNSINWFGDVKPTLNS